jgi:hypothetical protein
MIQTSIVKLPDMQNVLVVHLQPFEHDWKKKVDYIVFRQVSVVKKLLIFCYRVQQLQ